MPGQKRARAFALQVRQLVFELLEIGNLRDPRELGFVPAHTIEDAARDLVAGFKAGSIPDSMTDIRYFNIKTMQARDLK